MRPLLSPSEVRWGTPGGGIWHAYPRNELPHKELRSICQQKAKLRTGRYKSRPGNRICVHCKKLVDLTPEERTMPKEPVDAPTDPAIAAALSDLRVAIAGVKEEVEAVSGLLVEQLSVIKADVRKAIEQIENRPNVGHMKALLGTTEDAIRQQVGRDMLDYLSPLPRSVAGRIIEDLRPLLSPSAEASAERKPDPNLPPPPPIVQELTAEYGYDRLDGGEEGLSADLDALSEALWRLADLWPEATSHTILQKLVNDPAVGFLFRDQASFTAATIRHVLRHAYTREAALGSTHRKGALILGRRRAREISRAITVVADRETPGKDFHQDGPATDRGPATDA